MSRNGIRNGDIILIVLAVAIFIVISLGILGDGLHGGKNDMVHISTPSENLVYPLNEDRTVTVDGTIGKSVLSIQDGKIRFISSPCNNQTCLHGAVSNASDFIACLPNGVMVSLSSSVDASDQEVDEIVF
ncbi:MAG: hypothetical protein GXZ16_05245 [Spirochaetales bacterium]|jgi:hypothetical protein|nr:hypothetical protein [Spirochaetales bacterium]